MYVLLRLCGAAAGTVGRGFEIIVRGEGVLESKPLLVLLEFMMHMQSAFIPGSYPQTRHGAYK